MSKRIRITVQTTDRHAFGPSERIIEVYDPETGKTCLVSFARTESGDLKISPYCYGPTAGILVEPVKRG